MLNGDIIKYVYQKFKKTRQIDLVITNVKRPLGSLYSALPFREPDYNSSIDCRCVQIIEKSLRLFVCMSPSHDAHMRIHLAHYA